MNDSTDYSGNADDAGREKEQLSAQDDELIEYGDIITHATAA